MAQEIFNFSEQKLYDMRQLLKSLIDATPPQSFCERLFWKCRKRSVKSILNKSKYFSQMNQHYFLGSQQQNLDGLVFSNITESEVYNDLIIDLAKFRSSYNSFFTWDSRLTKQFFKALAITALIFKQLQFDNCKLGNSLASKLQMLDTSKLMILRIAIDPLSNKGFKELIKISMPQLRVIRIMNTNLTNDMLNLMTKRQFNIFYTIEFSFQLKIDGNRFLKNVLRLTDKREVSRISFGIQWFKSADIAPYYGYLSKIKSDFDRPQIIYLFLSSESKNLGFQNNMPRKLFSILNQRFKLKAGE